LSPRTCSYIKEGGERCRSAPLQEGEFCFWHSPDHAQEAAEARRLGGLRRRKEKVTSGAYDFEGLGSVGRSAGSLRSPPWTPWAWRTR
jgi:hypothetical protein